MSEFLSIFGVNSGHSEAKDKDEMIDRARTLAAITSDELSFSSAALVELIEQTSEGTSGIHDPATPGASNSGLQITAKGSTWTITATNAYIDEDGEVRGEDHVRWTQVFEAVHSVDDVRSEKIVVDIRRGGLEESLWADLDLRNTFNA